MTLAAILLLGVAIAFANGSNDVSKGVATLAGSGVCNLSRAVQWGVLWTGLGSLASAIVAKAMLKAFGSGLFAAGVHPALTAAAATIAGAMLWVALSTWKSWPVSTTHAIIGAISGVGILAYGFAGVRWVVMARSLLLPLLLSPVAALCLTAVFVKLLSKFPAANSNCLCVRVENEYLAGASAIAAGAALAATAERTLAPVLHLESCEPGAVAPDSTLRLSINHLHWLTSAATSFARGLNDSPKMVALLLAAAVIAKGRVEQIPLDLAVAGGIVLGSWIAGRRVTRFLALGITPMTHQEGFAANFVTAALVGPGAALGLPMSTTHVASGAIMGLALGQGKQVDRRAISNILLAWLVTLPLAALLGIGSYLILRLAAPHLASLFAGVV